MAMIASSRSRLRSTVFVDSNIPMYLVGMAHPNKERAQQLLEDCISRGERLVTDAEVFQDILHRYVAINRRDAIQPAFNALRSVVDEVLPVDVEAVDQARAMLLGLAPLSARDALHLAIMQRHDIRRILSFDRGFDQMSWVERLGR
jgi:uncharacterized protein